MRIVFNPSGTHVHKGFLKIRLDIFPETTDKTYLQQYVNVVDETNPEFIAGYQGMKDDQGNPLNNVDYQNWVNGLPHIWRLNPCLCHFLNISASTTKIELLTQISQIFNKVTLKRLDDALSKADRQMVDYIMKPKSGNMIQAGTINLDQINERFQGLEVRII